MHPLKIGETYALRLPDGRILGRVRAESLEDDRWVSGAFIPTEWFQQFRPLFEREAELRNDQIIPLWEAAADAIEALHIQVNEEGHGATHDGLRIFVEGGEAIIGVPLPRP